jgi:hypothetical protein
MSTTDEPEAQEKRVSRIYTGAIVAGVAGLFFLLMGATWMAGASLVLSIGSGLLAWGVERRSHVARWVGYVGIGAAFGMLLIDTLQTYLL